MNTPKYLQRSPQILATMSKWGFSPEVLQRMGTLAVVWGIFEVNLERALWALRNNETGIAIPSKEMKVVSEGIRELGKLWPLLPADEDVIRIASAAASELMEYRHSLTHGWMIPSTTMPSFIRNPSWSGVKRARPAHEAHVDVNLLDMAIDSAWSLCQVVFAISDACADSTKIAGLVNLKPDVQRAKSQAGELRHLTELMNHEKY